MDKRVAKGAMLTLALILMAPNVALLATCKTANNLTWIVALLVVPPSILAACFASSRRKPWLACLLLAPFAATAPVALLYILRYHTPLTEEVLGTVVATNPAEAVGFLGGEFWPVMLATAASSMIALLAIWSCARSKLRLKVTRAVRLALACLSTLALATFLTMQAVGWWFTSSDLATNHKSLALRLSRDFQYGYPFGLFVTVGAWWQDHIRLETARTKVHAFRFHPQRKASQRRQILVLVIGESSRRDQWQLFGAPRATNPQLSRLDHLIPIRHMVSSWPMTIGAVPAMLTRRPSTMGLSETFQEPSIVGLMREAGFDTWWLSNQSRVGRWNSPITLYAEEAAQVRWLGSRDFDEDLPEALPEVLRRTHRDLFIVLHMMGSHRAYDVRYPSTFKRFAPSMQDGSRFDADYRKIENSYDNTILYTDHVLARIIQVLRNSGELSALWYESDHGETLPSATCAASGHGHGFRYEFPVPALFWYSDAYEQTYPGKVATLRSNAEKPTTGGDTFATLADMAALGLPSLDGSRSLFSRSWSYQPRLIHPSWQEGRGAVDYDRAELGNGCVLVRGRLDNRQELSGLAQELDTGHLRTP